jgi:hypothetical protein
MHCGQNIKVLPQKQIVGFLKLMQLPFQYYIIIIVKILYDILQHSFSIKS